MNNALFYNQNQLRDYSSLFTRAGVQAWLKKDFTAVNYKIERYDRNWQSSADSTYLDYLKHVYHVLEMHYQNEYIFKNSFLNEWLIKDIGKSDSKVFSEFRIGKSVADLVMFNGVSQVFEIKTKLDSDHRLALQIENYRKVFNQIFLIVPEAKLSLYSKYDDGVGIISFQCCRGHNFTLRRKAYTNLEVDADTIMNILHTHEYKEIVQCFYGKLPEMTSFNQFNICKKLIKQMPNQVLNQSFINMMKRRDMKKVYSHRYHKEFNQLSLALKLNQFQQKSLIENLRTPLKA